VSVGEAAYQTQIGGAERLAKLKLPVF